MSCDCETVVPAAPPALSLPIIQTRAGMCAACPWLPPDAGDKTPCPRSAGSGALKWTIQTPAMDCAEHRWPDADGMVTLWGRRWSGVPDPLRWRLLVKLGREPNVPGCGCDWELKVSRLGRWLDPWLRISGELRGLVARTIAGWHDCRAGMAQLV